MATLPDPIASLTGADREIYDNMLARRTARGDAKLGPYVPLLNHPQLAQRLEALGFFLKYEGSLPREVYQFVVLAVAKRSGVAFVWEDHVAAARAAGLPENLIAAIETSAADLPAPFDLVHELIATAFSYHDIAQDVQDRAIAQFGVKGLIEIVVLCGEYVLMSMINGCFAVTEPSSGST